MNTAIATALAALAAAAPAAPGEPPLPGGSPTAAEAAAPDAKLSVREANRALREGDPEAAAEMFRRLAAPRTRDDGRTIPPRPEALYGLGVAMLETGRPREAVPALREAALLADTRRLRRDARFNLGHALLAAAEAPVEEDGQMRPPTPQEVLERLPEAAEAFRSVLEVDPADAEAARNTELVRRRIRELREEVRRQQQEQEEARRRAEELRRQLEQLAEQQQQASEQSSGTPPEASEQLAQRQQQLSEQTSAAREEAEAQAERNPSAGEAAEQLRRAEQAQREAQQRLEQQDTRGAAEKQAEAAEALREAAEAMGRRDSPQEPRQGEGGPESGEPQQQQQQGEQQPAPNEPAESPPEELSPEDQIVEQILEKERLEREARQRARAIERGRRPAVERDW